MKWDRQQSQDVEDRRGESSGGLGGLGGLGSVFGGSGCGMGLPGGKVAGGGVGLVIVLLLTLARSQAAGRRDHRAPSGGGAVG